MESKHLEMYQEEKGSHLCSDHPGLTMLTCQQICICISLFPKNNSDFIKSYNIAIIKYH